MTFDSSWCTLKVDNDNMHALMCLHANNSEEQLTLTEEIVMHFLASLDIIYGISHIAIQSMLEHVMYGQYICVAKGTPPLRGADGHYEYQKDMTDMKKKPLIHDDGTADYKNTLSLATINADELIAVYIPPTKGSAGRDIYGNFVPPLADGKDIMPLRGRGIKADDKNINYYAEYSGHIVMDGPKISVEKLYRVSGDLNIEVGNIHFDGDIEIMGDVRSGMEIDAKGDIFIHGHVGACKITSDSNISIEKGIQGRNTCVITAAGDVVCKFVERCTIYAGHNIYADSVLNSSLTAENQVLVTSKHGNVINSEIYGVCGVIVKEAGNSAGTPTLLRAGLPREAYIRANELNNLIQETDSKIAAFNKHLENLEKALKEKNDEKIVKTRMEIIRARIVLTSNKSEYMDELALLQKKIDADKANSYVNITGTVYEGVRLYIGVLPYLVTEAVREVSYSCVGNEVIGRSIDDTETANN